MSSKESAGFIGSIRFDQDGRVPAIVQEAASGAVLRFCWQDRDTLESTFKEGVVSYVSPSGREVSTIAEGPEEQMILVDARLDCDSTAVLLTVEPAGASCHLGSHSCFQSEPRFTMVLESGK